MLIIHDSRDYVFEINLEFFSFSLLTIFLENLIFFFSSLKNIERRMGIRIYIYIYILLEISRRVFVFFNEVLGS